MGAAAEAAAAGPPLELWAWAKVNLYLHVTGRRADGYHELDSLVVLVGVGDRLRFHRAPEISLRVSGPMAAGVPDNEDNLIVRAARSLAAQTNDAQVGGPEVGGPEVAKPDITGPGGAAIELDKRLPMAAGIGGGSSDCAMTLEGLTQLWNLPVSAERLHGLASALGADVPVCLYGRPAYLGGVGEVLERAPALPALWLVLANPGIALSTPAVFKARDGGFSRPARWAEPLPDAAALAARLEDTRNDLEAAAISLVPEIGILIGRLGSIPGALLARMSGSGATCFALFATRDEAAAGAQALRAERPDHWVAVAPLLHGKLARPWWRDC